MRHLFAITLAAVAGVAAFATEKPLPEIRGQFDRVVIPQALPAAVAPADATWGEIAALIRVTPAMDVHPVPVQQKNPDWRGYVYWQEFSNRLLREAGLRFYAQFPNDPRVWLWLEATLERQPLYLDIMQGWQAQGDPAQVPALDETARRVWRERYPALREACVAAPAAPEDLRVRLWCEELRNPIERESSAWMRKEKYDFTRIDYEAMGKSLKLLGETFPGREDPEIRSAVSAFFRYGGKYAPAVEARWRAAFKQSSSRTLRDLALSNEREEQLRTTPMEMRFTAVDGREVDLAKLRGKVVLIDFWASTWCGACKEQEPLLKAVYAKYHPEGFEIIGIACEMKPSDLEFLINYVKEHVMPWPQFFEGNGMKNEYTRRFGVVGIPYYLLLDRTGRLVAQTSSSGGLRNLEAVVRRELGLPPLAPGDETKVLGRK